MRKIEKGGLDEKRTRHSEHKNVQHVDYTYYRMGLNGIVDTQMVNETIEEIIEILISKKITVKLATQILEDTISSIEKEAFFEKRIINGEMK